MTIEKDTVTSEWVARIGAASTALKAASTMVAKDLDDPFEARRNIQRIIAKFASAQLESLLPPGEVTRQLDAECTRQKAEFWSTLVATCDQRGWELHGTTSRRLLNRGVFIESTDDEVVIETLPALQTFHVPKVVQKLETVLDTLACQDPRQFLQLIQRSFESLDGGERPIEDVYRKVLWHSQKMTFWKTLNPQQFVRITRPQFRSWLTQVLELGIRTPDERELRFGTTVQAKEAWEMYSPGEGRVVQVGRLALS